jgi:hypothetical protein
MTANDIKGFINTGKKEMGEIISPLIKKGNFLVKWLPRMGWKIANTA